MGVIDALVKRQICRLLSAKRKPRTDLEPSVNLPKVSQEEAASQLGISGKSVRDAKVVLDSGEDELIGYSYCAGAISHMIWLATEFARAGDHWR
jgi:hypothetical protein